MESSIKALKSGIWYTISNFLVRSIGIITIPIFTRFLTKTEFGLYNNYTSWLGILTIFVTLNIQSTLGRAKYDFGEKFDEYILSVLILSSVSAAIWFIIIGFCRNFFVVFLGMDYVYINAMLVYLFFLPAVELFQARERYMFEYRKTVITSVFLVLSTSVLSVLLVILMANRLTGRILGSVIPTVLLGVGLYLFFIKKGKRINISYWRYALVVCLPFVPHVLSYRILNSVDRIMIRKWCGAEETALYSLSYNCGSLISLLIASLSNAYIPWLTEQLAEKHYKEIRKFSKYYMIGFTGAVFPIMLLAPEILLLLGGKEYLEAKYVMPPVAMGCICQFIYTMFVNIEQFERKIVGMAIASVSAAVCNYILNYFAIPRWGYIAAAYTTLIGFLWLLVAHMLLVYRMGLGYVYSYRFIILLTIILCLCTLLVNLLYAYVYLRYLCVVIYLLLLAGFVFIKRNNVIAIIQAIRKTHYSG